MSQNRSAAVMQQRHEPHDSLDDFPTPPWATRAVCEWITQNYRIDLSSKSVREPCANRGYMVRPLSECFGSVEASDVHDYGCGYTVQDFLFPAPLSETDWTFANPPFRLAEQFIHRAIDTSTEGVAVIVRSAFLEGVGRYERLFRHYPPSDILQFVERVPMVKGRYDPISSTATSYCWMIWHKDFPETGMNWIAPCRKRLEREGDA